MRKQTAFKLPPDLLDALRAEAERTGVTMTSVVEQGIRNWLADQRLRREIDRLVDTKQSWENI